jgi:signal transduction histidine kinase
VENGVRYNRPGGFVSVRTQLGRDGWAELHVENSGPRVSPAAAARLSQPFERLERGADGRGAGLGLSIVSAVSEAHGGEVVIEPREAGGLRVSVRLPTSGDRRATDSGDARLPVVPA